MQENKLFEDLAKLCLWWDFSDPVDATLTVSNAMNDRERLADLARRGEYIYWKLPPEHRLHFWKNGIQNTVALTKLRTLPPGAVAEIEKVVVSAEQFAAEAAKKENAKIA
jgi:hypothetical protein